MVEIHIVTQGQLMCSFTQGPREDWPPGHSSVSLRDKDDATCTECLEAARGQTGVTSEGVQSYG